MKHSSPLLTYRYNFLNILAIICSDLTPKPLNNTTNYLYWFRLPILLLLHQIKAQRWHHLILPTPLNTFRFYLLE